MKIDVLTLFPEVYSVLDSGIIGKALKKGLFSVDVKNIRDYSADKHKRCDDYAFGGGAGMLMTPQPIYDAIKAADPDRKALRIYMSPKGKKIDQNEVKRLAKFDRLLFLSGSYEGVDQRVIDTEIDEELSIGDYVLTSGDLAALVVINAVARYIPDVLGSEQSTEEESFEDGLLEYPQYTRPNEWMGIKVPEVLLSGNHKEIREWRRRESEKITLARRPDIMKK